MHLVHTQATAAMATKNPRVVGYITPENHSQLKEFVQKRSLTESKAIDLTFRRLVKKEDNIFDKEHQKTGESIAFPGLS